MSETFLRSCAHWSEDKRAEMDAFYALATADYRILAEALDWRGWLEARQRLVGDRPLRLLDVACGSGKFPVALARHAGIEEAAMEPVDTALLDPSAFSIREARASLPSCFRAGEEYELPLQALDCPRGAFDIAWATHALYAVPAGELPAATERFMHAIGDAGVGVIAHSTAAGHYIRFHELFLEAFGGDPAQRYSDADQLRGALEAHGARVETRELAYDNGLPADAETEIEGFLQRCAFDDRFTLGKMRAQAPLGAYLEACLREGRWRFPQRVSLMFVTS
jgi:SAM-dependent methyltransferase